MFKGRWCPHLVKVDGLWTLQYRDKLSGVTHSERKTPTLAKQSRRAGKARRWCVRKNFLQCGWPPGSQTTKLEHHNETGS